MEDFKITQSWRPHGCAVYSSLTEVQRMLHALSFSNCFILVRAVLDPDPIPGTVGIRREFSLDGTVHHKVPCTHTHTHSHRGGNYSQPIHLWACFVGGERKPGNPAENHTNRGRTFTETLHRQKPELRMESRTLMLWGSNATCWTTVSPSGNTVFIYLCRGI